MKPVMRYHSQLLFRRSYKPSRLGRPRRIFFRPMRPATLPVMPYKPGSGTNRKP